jgi:hypothetical protein
MKQGNKEQYRHLKTGKLASVSESGTYFILEENGSNIPSWVVLNSDDWEKVVEKVVEKGYELLSFNNNGTILSVVNNKPFYGELLKEYLSKYKIHSVKRLSDGQVFTVGDKVDYTDGFFKKSTSCYCPINSFSIKDDKIYINLHYAGESGNRTIEDWVKVKPVLLVTEDGVDIYEGDYPWLVNNRCNKPYQWNNGTGSGITNLSSKHNKYFSTKEAAEDYLILNKPCLSVNDIIGKSSGINCTKEWLLELVKSKL